MLIGLTSALATKSPVLINALIEHCIQPRCLLSPMDADFCAQFIRVLHSQGTPGFHTLMCYDRLLGDHVKVVVFSCTEYEARNYGRFLLGLLSDLHKWHTDEKAYLQDNRMKVAGKTVILPGMQRALANRPAQSDKPSQPDPLSWTNFHQVHRKWHKKIAKVGGPHLRTDAVWLTWTTVFHGVHPNGRVYARLQCHHCAQGDSTCLPRCGCHQCWP